MKTEVSTYRCEVAIPRIRSAARGAIWKALLAGSMAILLCISSVEVRAAGLEREANTTLKMPAAPPTTGFTIGELYRRQSFSAPVAIATPPGETNRLFVVEQTGRIIVMPDLRVIGRSTFLDLTDRVAYGGEEGLLGLAFHPRYSENGYFYVFYTSKGVRHDRLSRFQVSPDDPNRALPDSEVILINQRDEAGNHNAGDVHFGPDGYLYVSLGDEGGANDQYQNSQRIDRDFFAGVIRIDVDKRAGNLAPNPHPASSTNYLVPADNPFVGATQFNGLSVDPNKVRTEFWAVGLRNPWRMSFDPATGKLWLGDVGQGAREEINVIERGGNYGWAYREGAIARPGAPSPPAGFTHINPVFDYGRSFGNVVTGGVVYRGRNISQLYGQYIFADFGSGNVWALETDETGAVRTKIIANIRNIAGFGRDPRNGDVLLLNLGGPIHRLIAGGQVGGGQFPPTLEETGAFADLVSLRAEDGIVPYDINLPFWSDNASKRRWFSVPQTNATIQFNPEGSWSFPEGTVWIKNFELELTNGVPESARRLETRFIVRSGDGVYGVTYRWDDSQTNAMLVPEGGLDEEFVIHDGGIVRTQVWHYPSRSECLQCHTEAGGFALGFNTGQMNRAFDYGEGAVNQLVALSQAGYFDRPVTNVHALRQLAHPADETYSREYRVRSYLQVNCAHCHQPGGQSPALFDARVTTPTAKAGLVNGALSGGADGSQDRVIRRGSLEHSVLLHRVMTRGPGQMPPIDSTLVDAEAVQLLSAWITNDLPQYQTFSEWQLAHFGSSSSEESASQADPDGDRASNALEYLTMTDPESAAELWTFSIGQEGDSVQIRYPRVANRGFEVQVSTNLLESGAWAPMDHPGNRPFYFSNTNGVTVLEEQIQGVAEKYYRIRVRAP